MGRMRLHPHHCSLDTFPLMSLPLVKPEQNKLGMADFAFFSFHFIFSLISPILSIIVSRKVEIVCA